MQKPRNKETPAEYLKRVRLLFKASKKQFGVFLGRSETMIKMYEKGTAPIPNTVINRISMCEAFYITVTNM